MTIAVLVPALTAAGSALAVAAEPAVAVSKRAGKVASLPRDPAAPKSSGITQTPTRFASLVDDGCNLSFGKNIVEFPEANGGVSVVLTFSSTIECSSDIDFAGESYLINRTFPYDGLIIAAGPTVSAPGKKTSTGVAGIGAAYPGAEQVETAFAVDLYSPTIWTSCNDRPGARILYCEGIGTNYLFAIIGSGVYDSKKKAPSNNPPPCTTQSQQWGLPGDVPVPADYLGDAKDEFAIYRPSTAEWWVLGGNTISWGLAGDVPVPSDYTGDGKADRTIYRPSTAEWWVNGGDTISWGLAGDIPVPADYVGDGRTERAIYRPSTAEWWVLGGDTISWGLAGDIPVPADFTGDGKAERAIWRPSTGEWWVLGVNEVISWGVPNDIPMPADFTGDGRADRAVYRPSTGQWFVLGRPAVQLGQPGDIPVAADFNGDGRADIAVWRPSNGTWYYNTCQS